MTKDSPPPWRIAPRAPARLFERFADLPPLLVQLLYNRGLTDEAEVRAFLDGEQRTLDSPFALPDMSAAVRHIRAALTAGRTIAVYGDYDADGVTATALLTLTLRSLGAKVIPYIPDRIDEGYGLHLDALRKLAAEGVGLLVTVDCGIRAVAEVAEARRLGMQIVITDHHHLGERLPPAQAILNPRREGTPVAAQHLAGVGVAYHLAEALLLAERQAPRRRGSHPLDPAELLDLVAVGTVADLVPMRGDNRALVKQGLQRLNEAPRPGLEALLARRNGDEAIDEETIAFQIAPRLNAAGRLQHADLALALLLADEPQEAMTRARQLEQLNRRRRDWTRRVQQMAEAAVADLDPLPPLLFVAHPDFPPGILGLAASRLLDRYRRPVVIVHRGEEVAVGSCRSPAHFHITQALAAADDLLLHYGGHAAAAGFTVRTADLPELERRLLEQVQNSPATEERPHLDVEAEVALANLSWSLYEAILQLAPFGVDNPVPLLASRGLRLLEARPVGRERAHLKLRLADEEGHLWNGIAFGQSAQAARLGDRVDLAYTLNRNVWRGRVDLELDVKAIVPAGRA